MPESGGIYYYSHESGTGNHPVIMLLHGLGGDHLAWPIEIRRLSGYHVITPDLPGHGNSKGPCRQSVNDYAAGIMEFLDSLGIWRSIFVGHSMGGAIALTIANQHPDRTVALSLVSCGARLPVPRDIMENAMSPTTFPTAIQDLQALMIGPATHPRLVTHIEKQMKKLRPSLVLGDLLACDTFDGTEGLSSITPPVLVISGVEDQLTPPRYSAYLAARIPGAALQTVDGAGHLLPQETPRRLARLLDVFFKSIPVSL